MSVMEREIIGSRARFTARQWRDVQTHHEKAIHWREFTVAQKLRFLVRHPVFSLKRALIRGG